MQHLKTGYPTDHPATCKCGGRGWMASYMGEDYWWCDEKHEGTIMASWDKPLKPYAEIYARLYDRIENMPESELRQILDAAKKANTMNCWFATYQVALILIPEIEHILAHREAVERARQEHHTPGMP